MARLLTKKSFNAEAAENAERNQDPFFLKPKEVFLGVLCGLCVRTFIVVEKPGVASEQARPDAVPPQRGGGL
jgi:hypothetical protein